MSHSFHIHFFTRLLIRVDRSKLKERIDNGLLFSAAIDTQGKTDKLLSKTGGKKNLCCPAEQRDIHSGLCG